MLPAPGPIRGQGQPGRGTNGDHKDIMSLAGLLNILDDDPQLRDVVAHAGPDLADAEPAGTDLVAPPALRPVLAAALAHPAGFVLAVTATAREAEDLAAGLGSFLPPDSVGFFPGWATLPHERLSPRSATRGPTLSAAAARSPCAAASWTYSRPPRSIRAGSSSSATRSRRSAISRSPTSAASAWPSTGCGRRRAASCC